MKAKEKLLNSILEKRKFGLEIKQKHLDAWKDTINVLSDKIFVQKSRFWDKTIKPEDTKYYEAVPSTIILNPYHLYISAFLSIPSDFIVTPRGNDIETFNATCMAEQILNSVISPKLNAIKYDLISTMLLTSRTLVKIYYDKNIGRVINVPVITRNPEEGIPIVIKVNGVDVPLQDENGIRYHKVVNGVPQFMTVKEGDVAIEVVSPFNYVIDPMALGNANALYPSPNQARWLIYYFAVTKEWCEERGIHFSESAFKETQLDFFFDKKPANVALYQEYYEIPLPSNNYEGRVIKLLGDTMIGDVEPLPKWCQRLGVLPFVDFADDPNPFCWYNRSIMSRVTRLQRRYTEIESIIYDIGKKVGRIRVALQRGAGSITFEEVEDDVIDELIGYGGNQPPVQIVMKDIPEVLLKYLDLIIRDIQLITLHDPRFPIQANRTAKELLLTLETDEQKLSPVKYLLIDRYSKIGEYGLEVIKENYPIGRTLQVLNDFANYETLYFHPDLLLPSNYAISIDIGNPFYMTRAGQLNFVTKMLNLGVFDPIEIIEFFYGQSLYSTEVFLDLKQAGEENFRLYISDKNLKEILETRKLEEKVLNEKITEIPEYNSLVMGKVEPFQNHLVHLKSHRKFLKKYYNFLTSFAIEKAIEHLAQHESIVASSLQQQVEQVKTKGKKK